MASKTKITEHYLTTTKTRAARGDSECILPVEILVLANGRAVAVYQDHSDDAHPTLGQLAERHDYMDQDTLIRLDAETWGYDCNGRRVSSRVGQEYGTEPDPADETEEDPTQHWSCTDGQGGPEVIEAETAEEAAQEYVDGGSWGMEVEGATTTWIDVRCTPIVDGKPDDDERECVTVTLQPPEPKCTESEHDWQSPEWLGGCSENPGVWGKGGGVVCTDVCSHCGTYRVTDTYAQRSDTGEQGLRSVSYKPADEQSGEWARSDEATEE
jgi:hypothetical protein